MSFVASAVALLATLATPAPAGAQAVAEPFTPVVDDVLAGDLVMAGNSNLVSGGGWRALADAAADVDGDDTTLCVGRLFVPAACGENSSSAQLDIPFGSHVVAARLYVNTSLSPVVNPVRARLDGPAAGFDYIELSATTPGITKVRESVGGPGQGAAMRQAVWDLTAFVQGAGSGVYTVADIMAERAGAYLPYASWTIVAAYELDPTVDVATMSPEQQARFRPRAVTWFDGFSVLSQGSVDITIDGYQVPAAGALFAKTFHVAAHPQHRGASSLLFGGQPLGNNAPPGNSPPPLGEFVGTDPACNNTTNILNDSICELGAPVATKVPGPTDYLAAGDGATVSSSSGVDFDVTRVPERYFVAGTNQTTLSLQVAGRGPVALGVLGASVDLPPADAAVTP